MYLVISQPGNQFDPDLCLPDMTAASHSAAANPTLRWMDTSQRGYFVIDIDRDRIETEYVFMPVGSRNATPIGRKTIATERGARKLAI